MIHCDISTHQAYINHYSHTILTFLLPTLECSISGMILVKAVWNFLIQLICWRFLACIETVEPCHKWCTRKIRTIEIMFKFTKYIPKYSSMYTGICIAPQNLDNKQLNNDEWGHQEIYEFYHCIKFRGFQHWLIYVTVHGNGECTLCSVNQWLKCCFSSSVVQPSQIVFFRHAFFIFSASSYSFLCNSVSTNAV